MKFKLADLNYDYAGLEPHIDKQTMEIHHTKHHNGYVNKLNAALEGHDDLAHLTIEDLLLGLNDLPADLQTPVRNNGGGHYNHTLFWESLTPGGKPLSSRFKDLLVKQFETVEGFKEAFKKAALTRFGSGWAWLILEDKQLKIVSTPNQDTPLKAGVTPLLGLDVWEHAYYLNYQNKRDAYIDAFWQVVDWDKVESRYNKA